MPSPKGFRRRGDRSSDAVPLGEVVDGLLRQELFARGLPVAKLAAEWSGIMGERMAAETAPTSLEHGVLTVGATDGPWGAQARFLVEEIRRRANLALGSDQVRSVRVVVRNSR